MSNITYTVDEVLSAPQFGVGSYSFEVTIPSFLPETPTSQLGGPSNGGLGQVQFSFFNAVSEPSIGDCAISGVSMTGAQDGANDLYSLSVNFSPLCHGLYDEQPLSFEVPDGVTGTWATSGPQYDYDPGTQFGQLVGTVTQTFTIEQTDLPVTTPEPSTLSLLMAAIACVVVWRRLRHTLVF